MTEEEISKIISVVSVGYAFKCANTSDTKYTVRDITRDGFVCRWWSRRYGGGWRYEFIDNWSMARNLKDKDINRFVKL